MFMRRALYCVGRYVIGFFSPCSVRYVECNLKCTSCNVLHAMCDLGSVICGLQCALVCVERRAVYDIHLAMCNERHAMYIV